MNFYFAFLTVFVFGVMSALPARASTPILTTLYVFCDHVTPCPDGYNPTAGLVQATDGDLYGVTYQGGLYGYTAGTAFKISPDGGALTTLANFCEVPACPQGYTPGFYPTGIIQGFDGDFYGPDSSSIFKMTPTATVTPLGAVLYGTGLMQAADGNFYGTTENEVFMMTPTGTVSAVHTFQGAQGYDPVAGVIQGTDGSLYGTNSYGGPKNPQTSSGYGTVFKISSSGVFSTLHAFQGTDGARPVALIQAANGDLYGVTRSGGAEDQGTVFRLTSSGTFITLHNFCSKPSCTDGAQPQSLIQGSDGNFYGDTDAGGTHPNGFGAGTLFMITPTGVLTTLYDFCGLGTRCALSSGSGPSGKLLQATNGDFYGVTYDGGGSDGNGGGTLFRLSVGLAPFVKTQTLVGSVGSPVNILGDQLNGSSRVTFNGVAATFTAISTSEITATVPVGATTGIVRVVTPAGTLSTNLSFIVRPD